MPAESVSVADRQHADAAREQCTLALTAPPLSTNNPASANQTITWLLGAVLVVALWLAL